MLSFYILNCFRLPSSGRYNLSGGSVPTCSGELSATTSLALLGLVIKSKGRAASPACVSDLPSLDVLFASLPLTSTIPRTHLIKPAPLSVERFR